MTSSVLVQIRPSILRVTCVVLLLAIFQTGFGSAAAAQDSARIRDVGEYARDLTFDMSRYERSHPPPSYPVPRPTYPVFRYEGVEICGDLFVHEYRAALAAVRPAWRMST